MNSYYDIDTILTDAQKVPCTFEMTIPNLGYLDGNADGDVKQGTKLALPLWLAEMLAVSQSQSGASTLSLEFPKALSPRVQNALKADPKSVDLRQQAQHFYALGCRMLELFDEEAMADILDDTFKKRAKEIDDQGRNQRSILGESSEFLRGLDEEERKLFKAAHESTKAVKAWMTDLKKA